MFKRLDTKELLIDLNQLVNEAEKSSPTTLVVIDRLKQILLKHIF